MPELTNNFEGGTAGNQIVADAAQLGGVKFDLIQTDQPTTSVRPVEYAAGAYEGSVCMRCRIGGTAGNTGCQWTTSLGTVLTAFYTSFMFKSDATPSAGTGVIMSMRRSSDSSFQGGVAYVVTTGKIGIVNASSVSVGASSLSITTGQWYRIESYVHCINVLALGFMTVRVYSDPASDVFEEITTSTPWNFTAAAIGKINFGAEVAGTNFPTVTGSQYVYYDAPKVGRTTGWYGADKGVPYRPQRMPLGV